VDPHFRVFLPALFFMAVNFLRSSLRSASDITVKSISFFFGSFLALAFLPLVEKRRHQLPSPSRSEVA